MRRPCRGPAPRAAVAALLLAAALAAVPAEAAKLAEIYPEFAARKVSLGRTVLLVDLVVVDDIAGKVEKVKLGLSRELANLAAASLARALADKGIPPDTALVASVGLTLSRTTFFQSDSVPATGPRDTLAVIQAPFFVDSSFADSEALTALRDFMSESWDYRRKKGAPAGFMAAPITLARRLRCETIALLYAVSWGLPMAKQTFAALLGDYESRSRTTCVFVLADGASGEVLWRDIEFIPASANHERLARAVKSLTEDLP